MTSVNSNNNYYEDVDTEDSAPMLHAGKGRRNRATSSSSRGCFEYLQLTIQLGIFLALVYLGLILTETKNQVNSFANDQNAMSAAVASTMGNVVLDLPGALVAILLNNTLPPIMDDIFSTDFAAVAREIEPIFTHGLVAYDTIYCAALEDDDQSSADGCTPDEYRSRGVSLIQAVLENVQEMSPPTSGTNNKPTSGLVQRMVQYYNWVETDIGSETWTKLHSKCIDTVNRFFQIKWDQSYPGVCNTNTSMWGLNVTHSGYAAGNHAEPGECECSMGEDDDDDKYPKPSTKCRVGHNEDCTCYVHRWESQVFNKEARKAAMTVCDSLAGVPPPPPPSPSAGKAGASVVGSQPRVSKSNLYRSVPRDE